LGDRLAIPDQGVVGHATPHGQNHVTVTGAAKLGGADTGPRQPSALSQGAKGHVASAGGNAKGLANGNEGVADSAATLGQTQFGHAPLGGVTATPVAARARVQLEANCSPIIVDAAIAAEAMEFAKSSHWRANSA
jgi:hypothetical protein